MSDWIVRRCEGLTEAESGDELFALHIERGTCYGFNGTATQVWKLIDQPRRVSELRDQLVQKFDVEPDACERDLRELLRDLEQDGLVTLDAAAP
jgi:hypothetical protein